MLANEGGPCNSVGQVVLKLKTAWRDGTTHILMSPLEFMQRLPALVHGQRLHFRTTASRRSILPIRCPYWVGNEHPTGRDDRRPCDAQRSFKLGRPLCATYPTLTERPPAVRLGQMLTFEPAGRRTRTD